MCRTHTGSTQSCQLTQHATLTSWTRRYYFFKRLNSYATLYGQYQQKRGQSLKNIWVCIHLLVCSVKHRASWQDKGTSLRVGWEFNGDQTCMRSTGIPDSLGGVTWAQNWPPTHLCCEAHIGHYAQGPQWPGHTKSSNNTTLPFSFLSSPWSRWVSIDPLSV